MTDKQIRDRIAGGLSASMMPMKLEAVCMSFLDRCLNYVSWYPAEQLPAMRTETCELNTETIQYEISDPILAFTEDENRWWSDVAKRTGRSTGRMMVLSTMLLIGNICPRIRKTIRMCGKEVNNEN